MHVRLAFSVAIQVDADIMLVDEVLAVGDASFQQKCFDQFRRLKEEGAHDHVRHPRHGAVERFCDRAMLLEQGDMLDVGDPARRWRERYNELNFDPRSGRRAGERAAAATSARRASCAPGARTTRGGA